MIAAVPRRPRCLLPGLVAVALLGCAGGCSRPIGSIVLQDAQAAVRVKTALVNDSVLGVRPIEVSVSSGIARLSGTVASDAEAQRAVELARAVGGIRDVRNELVVRPVPGAAQSTAGASAPGAAPNRDADEGHELQDENPHLVAVGVAFRRADPTDRRLASALSLGPLVRLGSGRGFGLSVGFGWFGADLSHGPSRVERVRIRPVMTGLAYTLGNNRLSASLSLVGGVAFNSLSRQYRADDPVWVLDVRNSLAWGPGVSLWLDLSRRTALNVSGRYLVTRPRLSVLDQGLVRTETLRGDTAILNAGVAYKLF